MKKSGSFVTVAIVVFKYGFPSSGDIDLFLGVIEPVRCLLRPRYAGCRCLLRPWSGEYMGKFSDCTVGHLPRECLGDDVSDKKGLTVR